MRKQRVLIKCLKKLIDESENKDLTGLLPLLIKYKYRDAATTTYLKKLTTAQQVVCALRAIDEKDFSSSDFIITFKLNLALTDWKTGNVIVRKPFASWTPFSIVDELNSDVAEKFIIILLKLFLLRNA